MAATKKIRVDRTFSTTNDSEDKGSSGTVEKARQLDTSRTINGVGFNGTANISFGTDSVAEGSSNKYYTDARARAALSGSTGISYNSSTGAITTSAIPNASLSNSSTTIGTTAIALGASSTTLAGLTSVTSTAFVGALTGNSSGTHTGAVVGNASTATTLATARAIQGVSFDGSAAITVVTAGTGVSVSGTAVSIGQAVGTSSNVTFNDLTVSGNLTVSGTTSTINSTTLNVADLNITVANGAATAAAANGAGLTVAGPATPATLTYTSADDRWNMNKTLTATLVGNVTGNVTGSAGTVTSISGNTLTSSQITTGLGFTPYNSTNPSGYTTNVGTVTGVTATSPVASSGGTAPVISMPAATSGANGYMTSTYASKLDGIAAGATNVTNTNQLTNGAGYYSSGSAPSFGATSTGALTVTGGITATGEITAYYSDDRLKKDITPITDPINKLMQIRGVTFRPNQTALDLGIVDKDEVGVIAQAVQAVLPQLVTGSAFEGYITVKYEKLTALLIEAVRAQQQQIDELKSAVAQLRGL